ncbi:MAG: metal-dependent hydrolase [Candidatus Thorarchaeota archaeon]|nr:metal-dependent hydrolase [Candidatus Thorarchaeota archaeon]
MEETRSYAVGHFAFGYILSKSTSTSLKIKLNIPLALALAVIPDVDIFIQKVIATFEHRGPTHSIIMASIVFVPIFIMYRTRAAPYFVALIQHSLVGDLIAGRSQILWPLTTQNYGSNVGIKDPTNIALEWAIFLVSIVVMVKTKDIADLLSRRASNLILIIPTFTVLLPTFMAYPMDVSLALVPPHVAYLVIFLASIIITCRKFLVMPRQA